MDPHIVIIMLTIVDVHGVNRAVALYLVHDEHELHVKVMNRPEKRIAKDTTVKVTKLRSQLKLVLTQANHPYHVWQTYM